MLDSTATMLAAWRARAPVWDDHYAVVRAQQLAMQQLGLPCANVAALGSVLSDVQKERRLLYEQRLQNPADHILRGAYGALFRLTQAVRGLNAETASALAEMARLRRLGLIISPDEELEERCEVLIEEASRMAEAARVRYQELTRTVADLWREWPLTRQRRKGEELWLLKLFQNSSMALTKVGDKPLMRWDPLYLRIANLWRQKLASLRGAGTPSGFVGV